MKLYDCLSKFSKPETEEQLTLAFSQLAPHFIYGGYIDVNHLYKVYIRTVEFYFHDESELPEAIKDPIVYHRNSPKSDRPVPYFPLMTLHAHVSGFDITFENEEQRYRASALIREYSIFDIRQNKFLIFNGKERNDRSTYLYDYLNGFSLSGGTSYIRWIDETHEQHQQLIQKKRRRVFRYRAIDGLHNQFEKTNLPDERQWSFKLNENIWFPTD